MIALSEQVGQALRAAQLTLVTAESCTGGLIGHTLTEISGSSAYFLGGIIAYSNNIKMNQLGVMEQSLLAYGAVSEVVAQEMAQGARQRLGADLAVSVTGIAGPGGGTEDKPVGLTYIGLATSHMTDVQRHIWNGNRIENKKYSAEAALKMILDYLDNGV